MENAWMGHADRAAPTELISVTNCFLYMREREGRWRAVAACVGETGPASLFSVGTPPYLHIVYEDGSLRIV